MRRIAMLATAGSLFAIGYPMRVQGADRASGEQLALHGTPPCANCHGADGGGNAAAGFPALAGQSPDYVAKQLHDFTTGARNSPVMSPIAKTLKPDEIDNLAAYYSALGAAARKASTPADAKLVAQGLRIATLGDATSRTQSCSNCHGPAGRGEPPNVPGIAGQPLSYLQAQIAAWRGGTRHNDQGEMMALVAKSLPDEQIAAVCAYFASLP